MAEENNKEKPEKIFVERDVLGQEKMPSGSTTTAKPKIIFIVFAILILLALIYWFFTGS